MRDRKITLIAKGYTPNKQGVHEAATKEREIWATEESIQQSEHAAAGQSGYRATARVTVWEFEYGGEKTAKYRGKVLEIYRVFQRNADDRIELYLGERVSKK